MNLKNTALSAITITYFGGFLAAEPLVDDFSEGLGNWTTTVILDNADDGDTGNNTASFQINDSNELELNTTALNGIDQYAFIFTGASLAIGEEAQVDMNIPLIGNRNLGLYVGGSAPFPAEFGTDTRENYISVYSASTGQSVATRGFDGVTEYNNLQNNPTTAESLFIAQVAENVFEVGYYADGERFITVTREPNTLNEANFVGVYADARATGIIRGISEFRIITLPFEISINLTDFSSGSTIGEGIGNLSISRGDNTSETASFSLVEGPGDTDNALFQIDASGQLQVNADFTAAGLDPVDGTEYFIRVRGDIDSSEDFGEAELVLTLFKDDDLDDLEDGWELMWANNLTDLTGGDDIDFDNDGLWDIDEFQLSLGINEFFPGTFPTLDPTNPDTDGDQLLDGQERDSPSMQAEEGRTLTSPILADSDFDGLSDFEEGPQELGLTGTDPNNPDFDGDGTKDGFDTDRFDDLINPDSNSSSVTVTPITDDASSEISSTRAYTHTISGGGEATVGGVVFDVLDDTNNVPNFDWTPDGDVRTFLVSNGGEWDTTGGGVTGTGIIELLTGFTFSGSAITPGQGQTYTLSGLTPGVSYDLRLYIRQWRNEDSGRPIDLTFTNGTEVVAPYCSLLLDRPAYVLNDDSLNHDQAYFLSYSYVAQGTELVIDARIPLGFDSDDSLHFYGLTNETVNAIPTVEIVITGATRNSNGEFVIDFTGPTSETFLVRKSTTLQDGFVDEAATTGSVTTDANGIGQAIITAAEAADPTEFYRLEN